MNATARFGASTDLIGCRAVCRLPSDVVHTEGRPTFAPGDMDLDGDVDRTDAALFTPHLGTTGGAIWADGDFDFDNQVTLADLALLQAHLGESVGPNPVAAANAVPEPGTLLVTLLVIAGLLIKRKGPRATCQPGASARPGRPR